MTAESNSKPCSRRMFLKGTALALSALPALKILSSGEAALAQAAPTQALDENFPAAAALGYVADASKADTNKFPKRKGPDGAKQFCHTCIFYTQGGLKAASKEGEYGKCTIFPQGLVSANGWCSTWTAKPGA
jgi:hypothetical protein